MTDQTTDAIVVLMTAGSREEAARLAEMLVGARLAACVQIMPEMESIYHWQGSIHRDPEFLLLAKTTQANFMTWRECVPFTARTPEIVAVPVTHLRPLSRMADHDVLARNSSAAPKVLDFMYEIIKRKTAKERRKGSEME